VDVGIDVELPLVHLSVIDDDGKDDDDVEEKQDNDNDDNEEDDDDKAADTASCCTSAGHPQTALPHPTLHSPLRGGSYIPHQQLPLSVVVGAADTEAVGSGSVGGLACSTEHEPLA